MEDVSEYIAIYNRYLSKESIFEKDNIGTKNIYTKFGTEETEILFCREEVGIILVK